MRRSGWSLIVVAASAIGCGGASSGPPTVDRGEELRLEQVGETLRNYQLVKGKPPRSLKELRAAPGDSGGVDLIASGAIDVVWGVRLPDTREEGGGSPDDAILAYGKDAETQGGAVLLVNRTVRRMSAEEFKAAVRAAPTP